MFITLLIFLCSSYQAFGCEVLFKNGTEAYNEVSKNLGNVTYFFIYGFSNIFEKTSFFNEEKIEFLTNRVTYMNNIPSYNSYFVSSHTNTELDGIWKFEFVEQYGADKKKPIIYIVYKKTESNEKAILLQTCELSLYFVSNQPKIRKHLFLFYFGAEKPNSELQNEMVQKYSNNFTVFPKFSKYGNYCDIVNYTFFGCPPRMQNYKTFNYSWIFGVTFLCVALIVFGFFIE
jgi:hypothetical protein